MNLSVRIPLIYHMWFEDGEGWCFDESIELQHFKQVARVLSDELYSEEMTDLICKKFKKDGVFLGDKIPQKDCKDPKAAGRNPFILRGALLDERFFDNLENDDRNKILKILQSRDLPDQRGTRELSIEFSPAIDEWQIYAHREELEDGLLQNAETSSISLNTRLSPAVAKPSNTKKQVRFALAVSLASTLVLLLILGLLGLFLLNLQ